MNYQPNAQIFPGWETSRIKEECHETNWTALDETSTVCSETTAETVENHPLELLHPKLLGRRNPTNARVQLCCPTP